MENSVFYFYKKNYLVFSNFMCVIIALAVFFSLYVSNSKQWYYIFFITIFFGIFSWVELKTKGVIILFFTILFFLIWKKLFIIINLKSWYISDVAENICFVNYIRGHIDNFFDINYGNTSSSIFFKMIFLNDKNYSSSIYYSLKQLSLIHIFTVSGFHLNLLFSVITFFNKKSKILAIVGIFTCIFYSILLKLTCGVFRSMLCLVLKHIPIFKHINGGCILSLCCIIFCFLQPNVVYDVGFQLSFSASICCYLKVFKDRKLINSIFISFFIFLITLPIILCYSNKVNLLSFIMNLIYAPIFIGLIYYTWFFSWFTFLFTLHNFIFDNFTIFLNYLANITIYVFISKLSNDVFIIIYMSFFLLYVSFDYRKVNRV